MALATYRPPWDGNSPTPILTPSLPDLRPTSTALSHSGSSNGRASVSGAGGPGWAPSGCTAFIAGCTPSGIVASARRGDGWRRCSPAAPMRCSATPAPRRSGGSFPSGVSSTSPSAGYARNRAGIRVHRSATLLSSGVTRRAGIPVTTAIPNAHGPPPHPSRAAVQGGTAAGGVPRPGAGSRPRTRWHPQRARIALPRPLSPPPPSSARCERADRPLHGGFPLAPRAARRGARRLPSSRGPNGLRGRSKPRHWSSGRWATTVVRLTWQRITTHPAQVARTVRKLLGQ